MNYFTYYQNELILLFLVFIFTFFLIKNIKSNAIFILHYFLLSLNIIFFTLAPYLLNSEISKNQYFYLSEIKNESSICLIQNYSKNGISLLEFILIKNNEDLEYSKKVLNIIGTKKCYIL
jgi:hypothetical protein